MPDDLDKPIHLFVVEDNLKLAKNITDYFTGKGFRVSHESDGALAVDRILNAQPDLVILDHMLPNENGLSICKTLRPQFDGLIVMFTANNDDIDHVIGLEIGADDYLIKPIQPRLLLAKVNSLLRRNTPKILDELPKLTIADLTIKQDERTVRQGGTVISFTTAEYELLLLLAKNVGHPLSRDVITENIRGIEYDGSDRAIDTRIARLRKKLDDTNGNFIRTVRGQGYMLANITQGLEQSH